MLALQALKNFGIPFRVSSHIRKDNPKSYHYTGDAYDIVIDSSVNFSLAVVFLDLFHSGGVGVSRNACRHIHIDTGKRRRFNEIHNNPAECTKDFRTEKVSFFTETYIFILVLFVLLGIITLRK